ncbi:hypothetical protein IC582_014141 [Cucumis melo]
MTVHPWRTAGFLQFLNGYGERWSQLGWVAQMESRSLRKKLTLIVILVIVEKAERSDIPDIDKKKP